ncbi:hypothetical protein BRADI_4g10347v3 [Brachypodium distachyon]|uniref:Uncharacterized protein n=1 Tax=Brachypodium distachyon TaxID=15368 RepID=A0A0Q3H1R0_BRADI|nr:hypothetical protein BRADI_4g10347v3 [Brachypodium distachyon]
MRASSTCICICHKGRVGDKHRSVSLTRAGGQAPSMYRLLSTLGSTHIHCNVWVYPCYLLLNYNSLHFFYKIF